MSRHICVDPESGSQIALTSMTEAELMKLSTWLDKKRVALDRERDKVAGLLEWRRNRRYIRSVLEFRRRALSG